ncbi:hypothetical protein SADUNF_Sadunf16G0229100 [Salix dunnii]|uniref:Uncharacterized protein n=1 Tax=Salix dunnii TaxID=1413687 RepID=A0A835J9Z8_9ROSI|nr:hypothetical protein SADUNF_Sadunf16G0229100 [Salix dunnii]
MRYLFHNKRLALGDEFIRIMMCGKWTIRKEKHIRSAMSSLELQPFSRLDLVYMEDAVLALAMKQTWLLAPMWIKSKRSLAFGSFNCRVESLPPPLEHEDSAHVNS